MGLKDLNVFIYELSCLAFCTSCTENPSGEIQDLVQNADLMEKMGQSGHYTLFAPTNEAFESLGSDVLERLQSDKEILKGKLG